MHIAETLTSTIAMFDNNDPNFQLVAEEWPTFLYNEEAGWNAEKPENSLFHGHVLTWVDSMPSPLHPAHHPFTPPTLGYPSGVPQQDCCSGGWAWKIL